MEENNEKKRHGRRRHFRGKNKDRSEGQQRIEGQGKTEGQEKAERPDQSDKSDRSARSDRRNKQEKSGKQGRRDQQARVQGRKEVNGESETVEKSERTKKEPDEVIFEFTWADAWGLYGTGYHVVIKDNKEHLYLMWSVDLSYGELKLGQRLQEFLDDMKECNVATWDGHRYTKPGIFDGDTWSIKVNSLTLKSEAQGTNEYPEEWKKMLSCLHDKWGIPVSKREQFE